MMRQFAFLAPAALIACALLCGAPAARGQAKAPLPTSDSKSPSSTLGPGPLSPAPAFALKSLTGETVSLDDLRGRVVLLNFWATWVGPCKILMPWLVELQSQYGPQGLQIVGVSLDDDATKVEIGEFADTMRVNYPILIGDQKVANAYGGIPAMPASFLIGRDGKVVERIIGLKGKAELEDSIKKALDPEAASASATPSPASKAQK